MKRIFTLLLCVAMLASSFAFTAFADEPTPAASAVIEMIMALDANTKPEQLAAIRDAYNALTPDEQATVFNYDTFLNFEKNEFVPALNAKIAEIPEAEYIDIYHFEKDVEDAYTKYNALTDEAKETVVGKDKIEAAKQKIDQLRYFNDNKKVVLLNSTMRGLAKYDLDSLKAAYATEPQGIYYYFEEVDMIERGDSTTGYYHPNNLDKIVLYKYGKLEMDIKWTDIDVINGWPMPFQVTNGGDGWSGYDFTNGIFWQGDNSHMDHGRITKINASAPYDLTYGVWHHFEVLYDNELITYTIDGEVVFETPIQGIYELYIIYPWLCNLEMTNVVLTEKDGDSLLSPFRNYVANPDWTGWTRSSNDEGTTMLDYIEQALADTRSTYNKLSDTEKEQIVGAEQIDRVQALIDLIRSGKNVVTVTDGSADVDAAAEGDTVTITAGEAPEGQVFDKWEIVSGEIEFANANAASTTFTMPATAVEVKATFKDKPAFTVGDANGDGKLNAKDVTAIMKYLVGAAPKNFVEAAADYDGNGSINAKDVTKLMKYLVANP